MQLLKISDQIESIVEVFSGSDHPIIVANSIQGALNAYSGSLTEWATQVAQRMVVDASDADYGVWLKVGKKISRETRKLLKESGTGDVFKKLQSEQVDLIKSLPLEASQKVHEWTKEGLSRGDRFEDIDACPAEETSFLLAVTLVSAISVEGDALSFGGQERFCLFLPVGAVGD